MSDIEKISKNIKGGKRSGAGRPKGVPNKKTIEVQQAVADSGITPLDYMLQVFRDVANEPKERLSAAISAAPYIHPRLSAVDFTGNVTVRTLAQELAELNDANSSSH